jgi:integrase
MSANFLTRSRHGTIYYFRRRIPIDLKPHIRNDLLLKSLNTTSKKIAVMLARNLASQSDNLFEHIRAMSKKTTDNFLATYTLEIDLDEYRRPTKIRVDAEPHETEAVRAAIDPMINSSNAQNNSLQPSTHINDLATDTKKDFQTFIDEYLKEADLKGTSKANYKSKLEFAKKYFGNNYYLLNVNQPSIVNFSTYVKSVIANPTTQGHYIQIVVSFINWHFLRHGIALLTSATLISTRKTPDYEDRDELTLDDVRVIFENAYNYYRNQPHKWWLTVAVAFTGCRVEEICQMNIKNDLKHDHVNNIWYIQIDERPEDDGTTKKSVKKLTSWRHLPIHSALIKHGFLEYLNSQKTKGATRPFELGWRPRVVESENINKWSLYPSKWGGRELDKLCKKGLIVKDKKTYFHSMRHTIARLMQNAGVSNDISEAIAGRSSGNGEQGRYAKINNNHELLSREGIEKGLGPLVLILDAIMDK